MSTELRVHRNQQVHMLWLDLHLDHFGLSFFWPCRGVVTDGPSLALHRLSCS